MSASGDPEPSHAHDWQVDVTVTGYELDASGCVSDFAIVQRHLRSITSLWDGKDLNEAGMFLDIPPSTEILAKSIYDQLEEVLSEEGCKLKSVTVWETENCRATYINS